MRFIDKKSTFYILTGINILLLALAIIVFMTITSSHHTIFQLYFYIIPALFILDMFFVWLAFITDSIIKLYYLLYPVASALFVITLLLVAHKL
ncbi:MAG: hypothetical protein H7259_09410 [Cytophagales bacterium]|nr:hypothetical protein [Cytophaga sp.]